MSKTYGDGQIRTDFLPDDPTVYGLVKKHNIKAWAAKEHEGQAKYFVKEGDFDLAEEQARLAAEARTALRQIDAELAKINYDPDTNRGPWFHQGLWGSPPPPGHRA